MKYIYESMIDGNGNVPCEKCQKLLTTKIEASCLCCLDKFKYSEFESLSLRKKIP